MFVAGQFRLRPSIDSNYTTIIWSIRKLTSLFQCAPATSDPSIVATVPRVSSSLSVPNPSTKPRLIRFTVCFLVVFFVCASDQSRNGFYQSSLQCFFMLCPFSAQRRLHLNHGSMLRCLEPRFWDFYSSTPTSRSPRHSFLRLSNSRSTLRHPPSTKQSRVF